jgi:hypothetical protein
VGRLRAIGAIFTVSAGLDAEQAATLHFLALPELEMRRPALRNQVKKRLMIQGLALLERHNGRREVKAETTIEPQTPW